MAQVNLLPSKFQTKEIYVSASKRIKFLGVLVTVVFFAGIAAIVGYVVVNSIKIDSLESQQNTLSQRIKQKSQDESQYLLAKSRAVTFLKIRETQGADIQLAGFDTNFIADSQILVSRAQISRTRSQYLLQSLSPDSLETLIGKLASGEYKKVVMTNLTYQPGVGFLVNLDVN